MAKADPFSAAQFATRRRRLGLSQPRLASELGVSVSAVRSWEQGWRNIPMPVWLALQLVENDHLDSGGLILGDSVPRSSKPKETTK